MGNARRVPIRLGLWLGVFFCAAGAVSSADGAPDAAPGATVIPARKAHKLLIHNVAPDYPPIAKMNYIQGRVSVQALVDGSGEVKEAHALRGHPFLAVAALKAVRNWLFKPAQSRQGPATFLTYVDVKFSLQARHLNPFPDRPEADLDRQVHRPERADHPPDKEGGRNVRLRVLIDLEGHVMDAVSAGASDSDLMNARQVVSHWTFRPARWGAIAVPWYLEVDVPIGEQQTSLSGASRVDPPFDPANAR
jgi:TonB family protein